MGIFSPLKFWDKTEKRTLSASAWETLGGTSSASGVTITHKNALTLSAVYCAVRVYTDAIASLPIHIIKDDGKNKIKDNSHPNYMLLAKEPNSIMTSYNWRQIFMPHLLMWGNSYNLIEFQGGGSRRPKSLMPIHPSNVTVELIDGILVYTVKLESTTIKVDQSQMLHIRGLGDNIEGKSVIDYAKDNLGLAKASEEFGSKFFKNGATTSGVLSTDQKLSDKAIKNLRTSYNNTYTGVNDSNKMMILEEGLKYQQTSIPPDNAQFLETRKFGVEDVARWFKLPPHIIGDLEHSTFSNIEHQDLALVKYSMMPYIINIEEEWNKKLFRDSEKKTYYTNMNVDGLLRGDIATRYDSYKIGIQNGFMTPNEARQKENMNPLDGLDNTWMQLNTAPVIDGTNQQTDGNENN